MASEEVVMEWSVLIETKAPDQTETDRDAILGLLGDFGDLLVDYGAAAGGDERGWDVRLSVETDNSPDAAASAIEIGGRIVSKAANTVGLPEWPIVRIEAREADTFYAQLEVSNFTDFLGTSEVCAELGVSRQRLHQLRQSERFPLPVANLAATPLWVRSTLDSFLAGRKRKPGHPLKTTDIDMETLLAGGQHPEHLERYGKGA